MCGFLIGFYFQGKSQVPERKVRRFNLRADWLVGSGARLGSIQSLSLFARNFTKWSSFTRWSSLGSPAASPPGITLMFLSEKGQDIENKLLVTKGESGRGIN